MSLEHLNSSLVSHDLVQDLKWDAELRAEFERDEAAVLDRYDLSREERAAIDRRDWRALYDLGFHPYLGAQFARIAYHSRTAGGISAAWSLRAALRGEPDPAAEQAATPAAEPVEVGAP